MEEAHWSAFCFPSPCCSFALSGDAVCTGTDNLLKLEATIKEEEEMEAKIKACGPLLTMQSGSFCLLGLPVAADRRPWRRP
jgi:hypothetical protein